MASFVQMFGGVVSAFGQAKQSQADEEIAKFNVKVSEQNEALALANSAEREKRQRREGERFFGAQRAAAGASGITTEGSFGDVLEDSAMEAELDALTTRYGGLLEAREFKQAANLESARAKNIAMLRPIGFAAAALSSTGTFLQSQGIDIKFGSGAKKAGSGAADTAALGLA